MENAKYKNIAVIYGGPSNEAEVSAKTADAVFGSLQRLGCSCQKLEFNSDIANILTSGKFDCVYNAMHGRFGEDGCLQGLLEIINIPYTHSGVTASALAMDKFFTKEILSNYGVNSPNSIRISGKEVKNIISAGKINLPLVIKPVREGSSVSLFIVKNDDDLTDMFANINLNMEYLIEKFVEGKEISVAVLDNKALGTIEIRPKSGVYDYHSKYTTGASQYVIPAEITKEQEAKCLEFAEVAHKVIGCKSLSRSDIIISKEGECFFLEINTHPGMTENSLVPKIAKSKSISFDQIVQRVLNSASVG
jgi:D-alanine--D-alanine ligase